MAYDASVKFNSAVAERRVAEFARSVGNLRTRLKEAGNAAKSTSTTIRGYTSDVNRASTRTRVLTRDFQNLGRAARSARADVVSLQRALNSGSLRGASAAMRQAAAGATSVGRASQGAATSARGHARASQQAATTTGAYGRQAKSAASSVNTLNQSVKKASQSFLGMASGLVRVRNLTAFLAGGFGIAFLVETADTAKLVHARLNLVAESEQNLVYLEKKLYDISARTRSGYKENAALFTKLAMAGKAYGVNQRTSLQVTENVSKAMKISGASASEAAAATQQLSQAFSSGRIQGDELRSVLENSPRLAQALAEELSDLGINLGNVRDKAKEGKIGINELVRAFGSESITKKLNDEFSKIPITIGDALTVAKTQFTKFVGNIDKATGITSAISGLIILAANNFDKLAMAATVAAIAVASQYVPAMLSAIKVTRVFALINLAAYGRNVKGAFSGMAGSLGLFNGVLKKSATSTLPAWRQIAGNVFGAVSLNAKSLFDVFRATVGRIPVVFAAVTAAMYVFSNDTKVISGELATTNDYIVTGFQIAFEKVGSIISWIADKISTVVKFAVDLVIGLIDKMVRAAQAASAIGQVIMAQGVAGGLISGDIQKAGSDAWSKGGVGSTFDRLTKGSEWRRRANERARLRNQRGVPGSEGSGIMPSGGGGGGGDGKGKKGGGSSEIDSIRSSLDSLRGGFDDVEKSRNEFNDGLKTLKDAVDHNIISATEYKKLLGDLAANVFPGLKDEIKDLAEENWKLQRELDGASEGTIKFEEGTKKLREQIDAIDTVIKKQGDVDGVLAAQRQKLVDQATTYGQIVQENETLKKLAEERKKEEEQITQLIDEASNKLYEMLTKRVSDALNFSKNSFKNFWKDVLGGAKDVISSVLGAYVFEPIRKKFRSELERAFKHPNASQSASGLSASSITGAWKDLLPANDNGVGNGTDKIVAGDEIIVDGSTTFFEQIAKGYRGVWDDLIPVFKNLFKGLGKLFEGLGINIKELGFGLGKILAGAQIGSMAAGATGGSGLGGALGGAAGQVAGEALGKVIGGTLGKFAGPLGAIAGGILGGAIGGLFKKKKYGTSVVTGGAEGDISTYGNSGSRKEASIGMAGNVQSGLNDVAERLGGGVGRFNVSIGKYKDSYRVSDTGRTGKLKTKYSDVTDFGDDESAAVAYAIKKAIEQGAITGIRASTQNLLKAGKDLEKALDDALRFEDVFTRFKEITDPAGAAMEKLRKEFEGLVDLFKKAGATSEEWTQLGVVFQEEIKNTISAQIDGLKAFRDDLIGGDRSYKSPTDRLKIADAKFKELEDKVKAGQYVDQDKFTEAGTALQELARQVYGSTPEFQVYQQRLLDATNKLITNAEAQDKTLQPVVDAINNQGKAATAAANQTNEYLAQILAQGGYSYNPANSTMVGGGGLSGREYFSRSKF